MIVFFSAQQEFFFQTVMVAADNGASDFITQSVPPAGNIERQHGSSKKNGMETQHALHSLAQMRDFQTLNLKKRVSLRWRAWIWKRACVSQHRNPKRRKHACVSLQKSKKTWKRTCVSHHNVEQWRKRACVSTLQAASRKKTRNVFKMCFLLHSDTHQFRWTIICVSVTDWKRACVSTQAQQNQMETRMCFHVALRSP